MSAILLKLHSYNSGLALVITLVVLYQLWQGYRRKQPFSKSLQRWLLVFSADIALQWLLGIGALIGMGAYDNASFWRHAAAMTLATIIAFLPHGWQSLEAAPRYRRSLMAVITVIVVVSIGVAFLTVNWHKKT